MPKASPPAPSNDLPKPAEQVRAGAKFLDDGRRVVAHWRRYIDTGRLDMGRPDRDLLSYLGTRFDRLGLTLDQAIAFGFEPEIDDRDHTNEITAAWKAYLAEQLAEVA